jgi:hypothetical protein
MVAASYAARLLSILRKCLGNYCPARIIHNFTVTFAAYFLVNSCRHYGAMRSLIAVALFTCAAPVAAQVTTTIEVEEVVYEDVEADSPADSGTQRYLATGFDALTPSQTPLASYGPFHMISPTRAELIGSIESGTPAQFAALLRAFPALAQIDMVECPGTGDDEANLALARMVRRAGIATHVPDGGSVRSGGVELFLAGAKRSAAPTAQFAVHSWMDENGLEAGDYAADDPAHRDYIDFYREMGMAEPQARAFYAMTNSAPHDEALYLSGRDLARYVALN